MPELMYSALLHKLSRRRVLQHILFWLGVTVFFYFVFGRDFEPLEILVNTIGFMPGHMIFVYSLIYVLIPHFIFKRRMYAAIPVFFLIVAVSLLYLRIADVYLLHYSGFPHLWRPGNFPRSISVLFSVGWIAVSIKLLKHWFVEKELQQKLEKEKLTTELLFLRSQLHPHFLFNTLNNLYSLSLEKSSQAPQAILKLSALLRYILYESDEPAVPIAEEIGIIQHYIGLEQLRYGQRLEISTRFTGDMSGKQVAPLLLLPFVENCFKHGVSEQLDVCWISLHLHVSGEALDLKLVNSCHPAGEPAVASGPGSDSASGLGLQNVRRRLNLLYPGCHSLKMTREADTFTVSLRIPLSGVSNAAGESGAPITKYYETEMYPG
ncbi:MAG: histidine kinase [Bacteroidota bacterium]|nr:histidine kinase [Bacteroidota bacterium]MDP4256528.1 histidine kinase [Bacteroidota bacterium]MDP4259828.1 histidine kinase [Bacteroidota bacterium]